MSGIKVKVLNYGYNNRLLWAGTAVLFFLTVGAAWVQQVQTGHYAPG